MTDGSPEAGPRRRGEGLPAVPQPAHDDPGLGCQPHGRLGELPENIVIADIYADALSKSGVLLQFYDKKASVSSSAGILKALPGVLPSSLMVLNEASAEDRDAIVVTAATAKKYNLKSIADLAKKAP